MFGRVCRFITSAECVFLYLNILHFLSPQLLWSCTVSSAYNRRYYPQTPLDILEGLSKADTALSFFLKNLLVLSFSLIHSFVHSFLPFPGLLFPYCLTGELLSLWSPAQMSPPLRSLPWLPSSLSSTLSSVYILDINLCIYHNLLRLFKLHVWPKLLDWKSTEERGCV